MIIRKLLLPVLLGAAFGVPLIVSRGAPGLSGETMSPAEAASAAVSSGGPAGLVPAELAYVPTFDLAEIFRFDINPGWVTQRWPRVSASPAVDSLAGMRVALCTGTTPSDLTGSLTYYFDRHQRAQRIVFQGWTGDAQRTIALVTQRFGFRQRGAAADGMFTKKSWFTTTGLLLMSHMPVLRQDAPTQQIAVYLELTNPDSVTPLTSDGQRLVERVSK
jgi:hypothetical protein